MEVISGPGGSDGKVAFGTRSAAMEAKYESLRLLAETEPATDFCSRLGDCFTGCFECFFQGMLYVLAIVFSIIPITWLYCFRTLNDYERGVVFRFGKFIGEYQKGFHFILPFIDEMYKVDTRLETLTLRSQETLTKESITVLVTAVVLFQINNAKANVLSIGNSKMATRELAAAALRSIIGESELDEILGQRTRMNERLHNYLDKETDHWGLRVTHVEIKDVMLPKGMQRAMGAQAESERERRARVINAEGEVQAAPLLLKAAETLSKNSASLQLRFLDTLRDVSAEKNSTIVFPLPIEFLKALQAKGDRKM